MKKYFLLPETEVPKDRRKLNKLNGWEKEISDVLLNSTLSEKIKFSQIQHILENVDPENNLTQRLLKQYVQILPKN